MLSSMRCLTLIAVVLALLVVMLGAWTRINNAGLSCPDWPGCYGQIVVPGSLQEQELAASLFPETPLEFGKAWLEMGHRYLAGLLGLLIATVAVLSWKMRKIEGYPFLLSQFLLLLVVAQALFGMWTVTMKLLPQVVTLHLLGGMATLALLVMLNYRLNSLSEGKTAAGSTIRKWIGGAIGVLFLQLILGGWTSSNYAGYACEHWLFCNPGSSLEMDFTAAFSLPTAGDNYLGGQLPLEGRAAIQVSHRLGALLVSLYCLGLYLWLRNNPELKLPLRVMLGVLLLQLGVGVLNVLYAVPVGLAMVHHAGAVLLMLALLWLYQRADKAKGERGYA